MAISQESLLGMLIPDIYIDGITLESSGTPAIEDNPHIEDDREAASREAYRQASENRTLRMTVDISLKERLDNNLIGTWFRQQEFHKYLKIQAVMTTSRRLAKVFSHNQAMFKYAGTGIADAETSTYPESVQAVIDEEFSSNQEFTEAQKEPHFSSRILSVSADVVGDNSDLTQISSSVDENGTSIHDFTYRVVYELNDINPKNLSVFAASYLDLGSLKEDFGLEFDADTLDMQNGKVVSESIIKNGSTVSTANVYVTPDGEYWTGPIHKSGSRSFSTGSVASQDSVKLIRRSVPNNMIQDFRDVADIMKYSLDISDAQSTIEILNRASTLGSNQRAWMDSKTNYFSDIWISRSNDGASRFMFAFDVGQFLRSKSRFGNILDRQDPMVRRQILNASTVRSLTLLRRRIKEVNTLNHLGNPSPQKILFDKSQPYHSIILSANGKDNVLVERSTPVGVVRESFLTIPDDDSDFGVHYYTGQDRQMSAITDGRYQYGVRIDVEDGTVNFLRSITEELSNTRRELRLYLEYGMKLGMTKYLQEVSDPHIDHENERRVSIQENTGHYDPLRNKFTQRFITFLEEQKQTVGAPFYQREPWMDAAAIYANALAIVSSDAEHMMTKGNSERKIDIATTINIFLAPDSGTPFGILTVIRLFDQMISKLQSLTGDDYRERGRASMSPSGSTSASSVTSGLNRPGTLIDVEHWFAQDFDSNVKKTSGLDYLTSYDSAANTTSLNYALRLARPEFMQMAFGNSQARGLKIVDGGTLVARFNQETEKLYTELNPNIDISDGRQAWTLGDSVAQTSFGFLSPSFVVADDIAYSTHAEVDDDYYIEMEAGLLASKEGVLPPSKNISSQTNQSDAQKGYQSTLENIFSTYNVVVQTPFQKQPVPLYLRGLYDFSERKFCEDQQLQAVDPYPAWNEDADGNIVPIGNSKEEKVLGEANSNYTDFFKKISDIVIDNSVSPGDMDTNTTASAQKVFSSPHLITQVFETMKVDSQYSSAIASSNGVPVNPTGRYSVSEVISSMPNHFKSIISSHFNPSVSKHIPRDDWFSSAKFNINYGFLSMVERFDGFEEEGLDYNAASMVAMLATDNLPPPRPCLKQPRWKTLTQEFYLASAGKEILCRLTPYVCQQLGIVPKPGIETPVYDAYFIIVPPRSLAEQTTAATLFDVYRARLSTRAASTPSFLSQIASTALIIS